MFSHSSSFLISMKIVFVNFVICLLICAVSSAPQNPELNDQFEETNKELKTIEVPRHTEVEKLTEIDKSPEIEPYTVHEDTQPLTTPTTNSPVTTPIVATTEVTRQPSFITTFYKTVTKPIAMFLKAPKVSTVLTNIGTCVVNGAMEIISFYFPAPLIPLIASAAGLVIPFEPIVMLREKMPVTSYRRALKTALKGFLGTFDGFKLEEEDPYMTGRFNRRFMGDIKKFKEETVKL